MIKLNMNLLPEVARRFVADMEAFYRTRNAIKRDEIAGRQLYALREHLRPRDPRLRLSDVKELFERMRDISSTESGADNGRFWSVVGMATQLVVHPAGGLIIVAQAGRGAHSNLLLLSAWTMDSPRSQTLPYFLAGFVISAAGVSGPGVSRPGTRANAATNAINPAAIIARKMRSISLKSTMGRPVPGTSMTCGSDH
jgi:hypothetical protein